MKKSDLIKKLCQKIVTVGDLKEMFDNIPDDTPVVVSVDGGFGYASDSSLAFASTWDAKRVWVTEDRLSQSEFILKNENDLVKVVYLKCSKQDNGE